MKNKTLAFVAVFLLLALLSACALAERAVVDNGKDPSAKLNMREQASRDARVIGQFYSGTPVEIVADAGDGWSQVRMGSGRGTLSGYMMTQYLAGSARRDGTYGVSVASPYGTQSVVLRSRASNSYDAVAMLQVGDSVRVLGVSGNYLIIRTEAGAVGYLASEETAKLKADPRARTAGQ